MESGERRVRAAAMNNGRSRESVKDTAKCRFSCPCAAMMLCVIKPDAICYFEFTHCTLRLRRSHSSTDDRITPSPSRRPIIETLPSVWTSPIKTSLSALFVLSLHRISPWPSVLVRLLSPVGFSALSVPHFPFTSLCQKHRLIHLDPCAWVLQADVLACQSYY